ncbi:olfactory receptor 5V1-like [Hyla sarda]|uniref:olfactory receptor 5V1-like n=1 Tax=Hyla sarda TaxID=327740 RepID=UPI0024C42F8F|nr:olfactory receptor 5V1-like [Hyla sarda]
MLLMDLRLFLVLFQTASGTMNQEDKEALQKKNSQISEFVLLGLSDSQEWQSLFFVIFFFIYIITVGGNVYIILAYRFSPNLHTPMYFYLANFSFLDICYITGTVPKMLSNFLSEQKTISVYGCSIQMYCVWLFGGTECYILAAMAYDRYNAICHPLLYQVIMNKATCTKLIIGSWVIGAVNSLIHTVLTFSLTFCSNKINHFFCDVPPVLELSCTSTWINELVIFFISGCVIIGSFILIMISYIKIISAIFKAHSRRGRRKTFSTCTSHLIVVTIFYGSGIFMYFRPKSSYGMDQDRLVSVMYTVIAPMLNPFVYSLRNSEVKLAMKRILYRERTGPFKPVLD